MVKITAKTTADDIIRIIIDRGEEEANLGTKFYETKDYEKCFKELAKRTQGTLLTNESPMCYIIDSFENGYEDDGNMALGVLKRQIKWLKELGMEKMAKRFTRDLYTVMVWECLPGYKDVNFEEVRDA